MNLVVVVLGIVEVFFVIVLGLLVVILVVMVYNKFSNDMNKYVICLDMFVDEFINVVFC